jgi:predicted house-cleaning NTP pyrophosphatase (Maf/HAM1 superfamily)
MPLPFDRFYFAACTRNYSAYSSGAALIMIKVEGQIAPLLSELRQDFQNILGLPLSVTDK